MNAAQISPKTDSPAISPEAVRTPAFSTRRPLRLVESAPLRHPVSDSAKNSAEENRECRLERQIHTNRHQHRAPHLHHDHGDAEENSYHHQRPGHVAADDADGQGGHQARLRRGELTAAEPERGVQQVERPVHGQAGDDYGNQFRHLNFARRAPRM